MDFCYYDLSLFEETLRILSEFGVRFGDFHAFYLPRRCGCVYGRVMYSLSLLSLL